MGVTAGAPVTLVLPDSHGAGITARVLAIAAAVAG